MALGAMDLSLILPLDFKVEAPGIEPGDHPIKYTLHWNLNAINTERIFSELLKETEFKYLNKLYTRLHDNGVSNLSSLRPRKQIPNKSGELPRIKASIGEMYLSQRNDHSQIPQQRKWMYQLKHPVTKNLLHYVQPTMKPITRCRSRPIEASQNSNAN